MCWYTIQHTVYIWEKSFKITQHRVAMNYERLQKRQIRKTWDSARTVNDNRETCILAEFQITAFLFPQSRWARALLAILKGWHPWLAPATCTNTCGYISFETARTQPCFCKVPPFYYDNGRKQKNVIISLFSLQIKDKAETNFFAGWVYAGGRESWVADGMLRDLTRIKRERCSGVVRGPQCVVLVTDLGLQLQGRGLDSLPVCPGAKYLTRIGSVKYPAA